MEEEIKKIIKNSEKIQLRYRSDLYELLEIKKYKCFFPYTECWLAIFCKKSSKYLYYECCYIKNENVEMCFSFLQQAIDEDNEIINSIIEDEYYGLIMNQIGFSRLEPADVFLYDFNHDGKDEVLAFLSDYVTNDFYISSPKISDFSYNLILNLKSDIKLSLEFINYNGCQGIKILTAEKWTFYYYDRLLQKYVQDEKAKSEDLERIHGSPDFFAEAGIDYTKLERPLFPADLEGFSKQSLRIWRNAVYARHGRIFRSEDLQALFNEYVWYKPDENYTDEKLSDVDRANIKLIKECEKK